MEKTVQELLEEIKQEGVQLRSNERITSKAAQKRRREARKDKAIRRERDRAKRRLRDRRREGTLYGQWRTMRKLHRSYARRWGDEYKWSFELTFPEWMELWMACPNVVGPGGVKVPAWTLRGQDARKDVRMLRINPDAPWTVENTLIKQGGMILVDGRKLRESENSWELF